MRSVEKPQCTIALWNVEWATATSKRGGLIRENLHDRNADLICLTEGVEDLLPDDGFIITSDPDYGYPAPAERRKVLLWSRNPWTDTDRVGDPRLPGGRFVRGKTTTPIGVVDVVGVCIPWRDAHVRNGRRDRGPWEDHRAYLESLPQALPGLRAGYALILGDFNQCIPRRRAPVNVFETLLSTFAGWRIATAGPIGPSGLYSIDHVAHGESLVADDMRILPMRAPCGTRLSDHFGLCMSMHPRTSSVC